jgi:hypothetical protein
MAFGGPIDFMIDDLDLSAVPHHNSQIDLNV